MDNDIETKTFKDKNGVEHTTFHWKEQKEDKLSDKFCKWVKDHKLRPYVKIKDLNNSEDNPYVNKPKPSVEVGLKFDF